MKIITDNKRAFFEYSIIDRYEAGIVLVGSEVKSAHAGLMRISDSFCRVDNGEVWLKNSYIKEYDKGSHYNVDAYRDRKLLLHRHQINKLSATLRDSGVTIVPTKAYFKDGKVKIEIATAKGKKLHDKRHTLKEKDLLRQAQRELK